MDDGAEWIGDCSVNRTTLGEGWKCGECERQRKSGATKKRFHHEDSSREVVNGRKRSDRRRKSLLQRVIANGNHVALRTGSMFAERPDTTIECSGDQDLLPMIFRKLNEPKPRLQESSPALPAQPETPNDGHLAGLLTYASANLKRLPGLLAHARQHQARMTTHPSGICSSSQRLQLRGSGGFSPRFPLPDGRKLI